MKRTVMLLVLVLGIPHLAFSEDGEKKKELPKSGVLSSTYSGGATNVAADLPWGEEVGSKEQSPVTGSISRAGERTWRARVYNNSKSASYSVSVEAVQYANNGNPVKRDSYSYTLRPSESKEVDVGAAAGVERAELKLLRWKDLSPKPKEESSKEKEVVPSDKNTGEQ